VVFCVRKHSMKSVRQSCAARGRSTNSSEVRRRLPPRLPRRNIDVYITPQTQFKAQLSRCERLLASGEPEILLHALGAAIPRALNLVNVLQKKFPLLSADPRTSTLELTDNFEPHSLDVDTETVTRFNSALHIRLFRSTQL